jgi:hypothetical protein
MELIKSNPPAEISTLGRDPQCMVCDRPIVDGDVAIQLISGKVTWDDCCEVHKELVINFQENEHETYFVAHTRCYQRS